MSVTRIISTPIDPTPRSRVIRAPSEIGNGVRAAAEGALAVARGTLSPGMCTTDALKAAKARLLAHAKTIRALALEIET